MICSFIPIQNMGSEFESRSGEVYSIQHYVIKFVCELQQFGYSSFLHL